MALSGKEELPMYYRLEWSWFKARSTGSFASLRHPASLLPLSSDNLFLRRFSPKLLLFSSLLPAEQPFGLRLFLICSFVLSQ